MREREWGERNINIYRVKDRLCIYASIFCKSQLVVTLKIQPINIHTYVSDLQAYMYNISN